VDDKAKLMSRIAVTTVGFVVWAIDDAGDLEGADIIVGTTVDRDTVGMGQTVYLNVGARSQQSAFSGGSETNVLGWRLRRLIIVT